MILSATSKEAAEPAPLLDRLRRRIGTGGGAGHHQSLLVTQTAAENAEIGDQIVDVLVSFAPLLCESLFQDPVET
jgi:hypothetical protein